MRLRRNVLGLLLVLLVASPAIAAFTATETTSVQRVFAAGTDHLHAGMSEVFIPLRETTDATRPRVANVARLVIKAQGQLAGAVADLVGGSYLPTDVRGRGFFVTRAVQQIDAAKATLAQAQTAAGVGVHPNLDRLRTIHIPDALRQLNAFDRTLAFNDPYPEAVSPGGRRLIVGPHGLYDQAQARLTSATTFLLMGYDALLNGYAADSVLPSYEPLYQQMKFASLLYRQNVQAMATVAGVPLTLPETTASPFFRVLRRIETLTHGGGGPTTAANHCAGDTCHGTPYNYNNLIQHYLVQIPYWTNRPTFAAQQRELLRHVAEAWDSTDSGVWFQLDFPECDQLAAPSGCGGTGN